MKILLKQADQDISFEFNTFTFRVIDGSPDDKTNLNFSLQIINFNNDSDFTEIATLYNLFNFWKENFISISRVIIMGDADKKLFDTELLNLKPISVACYGSVTEDNFQPFINITLNKIP